MNRVFSLEDFLHSPTARRIRRGLPLLAVTGILGDWYVMHLRETFPREEGQWFVVDYSPIGRPRPLLYVLPTAHYTIYSPWTPVNGDLVYGRCINEYENWIQLIGGRYLERQTCGVELCTPLPEYEKRNGPLTEVQLATIQARSARQAEQAWTDFWQGLTMAIGWRTKIPDTKAGA